MPVYEKALTIPANTSEDAPVEATLEIEGDTVIRLEIECVRRHTVMGDYFVALTIPPSTPEDASVQVQVQIQGHRLEEIAYLIPAGWCALAHFAVFYGIYQIYPTQPRTWVTGDNLYRVVPLRWPLPESPCTLTIRGWNEDTKYQHTVYIWLLSRPAEEILPVQLITQVLNMIRGFLRRIVGVPL